METKKDIDLSFIFDDDFVNAPIEDGGQCDFYKNREHLAQETLKNMEALRKLYSEHPYAIECSQRLRKESNELEQLIKSFHKLIFYIEYSPKDEQVEQSSNEELHPLDKVIAKNLHHEINNYLDFHSIDRNNMDTYAMAVIEVTKSVSRAVYKDGFEEELFKYIEEGKQTLDNIKKLIETHPYTTNKGISDKSIETTKQLYTDKINEILEKMNYFLEE